MNTAHLKWNYFEQLQDVLMNSRTSLVSRTCLPERDLNFEATSRDWSALQIYPFSNTHSDKLMVG